VRSLRGVLSLLKERLALLVCGIGGIAVVLSGCCSVTQSNERKPSLELPIILSSSRQKALGAFLFVHGLNLNLAAMTPLRTDLQLLGYHSYQVVLAGHKSQGIFP
jgi:hypothetical protein